MDAQSEDLGSVGASADQRDLREEHLADQIWQLADLVDEGDRERRLLLRTVMTLKAELVQLKETVAFMAERMETVPDSPVRADMFNARGVGGVHFHTVPDGSMGSDLLAVIEHWSTRSDPVGRGLQWSESQQLYCEPPSPK